MNHELIRRKKHGAVQEDADRGAARMKQGMPMGNDLFGIEQVVDFHRF